MKRHDQILIFLGYILLLLLLFLFLLIGCSSTKESLTPTHNKGGYKIKAVKFEPKNTDLKISGTVYDVNGNKPLTHVELSIGCSKIQNSANGEYNFIIKNHLENNPLFIEAISIGYQTVRTNFISIVKKNNINIDFYLSEDDRPFINCEGIN